MITQFHCWVAKTMDACGGDSHSVSKEIAPPDMPKQTRDDTLKIISNLGDYQKATVCCVYILLNGSEVLYVGQSKDLYQRIAQHKKTAPFDFDRFAISECEPEFLGLLEAKFIHELNPRWNKEIPAYGGKRHYRKSFTGD